MFVTPPFHRIKIPESCTFANSWLRRFQVSENRESPAPEKHTLGTLLSLTFRGWRVFLNSPTGDRGCFSVSQLCWFALGGPSTRSPQSVGEVAADHPRGHRRPSARCLTARLFFVLVQVLERLSFDLFCRWTFGAWNLRTVRTRMSDGPWQGGRFAGPSRTVRFFVHHGGLGSNFGRFAPSSRTIRLDTADGPPGAFQIAYVLFELCFRVGLSCGLFLGLVGPLWLCDLGKLVWESVVVNLRYRPSSSSGMNFYRLPFTPPSLVA
jgi:hypothetical protein